MRRKFDFYATPGKATRKLLEYCPELLLSRVVIEPCAGDMAIASILKEFYKVVLTNDIDPSQKGCDFYGDAKLVDTDPSSVIITNPPFNQAIEIVSNFVGQGCPSAFLLRLSFLEPTEKRGDWLKQNPPAGLIILPRISFTNDGKTDSVTCAWMVWNVEPFGVIVVPKSEFK